MTPEGSVTQWIRQVKEGDEGAAEQLWNRYFHRLAGFARTKMTGQSRRTEDEEDVVLVALASFFDGARQGRYPILKDRHNLWPLLAKITEHKVLNQREREFAQKRGAGKVRGDSAFGPSSVGIKGIAANVPSNELAGEICGQCHELLEILDDKTLRTIALRKLEGYTNAEIGREIGRVPRTVERKLDRIRAIWSEELSE